MRHVVHLCNLWLRTFVFVFVLVSCICIFSCPDFCLGQLYTYPCHSLSCSLTPTPFTFWHSRAILETYDLWDIWSEWWGDMTWPKKYPPTYLPTYLPLLENTPGSNSGDLWLLRHLIRVMRRHDLTYLTKQNLKFFETFFKLLKTFFEIFRIFFRFKKKNLIFLIFFCLW